MNGTRARVAARSHVGRVRKVNQDACLVADVATGRRVGPDEADAVLESGPRGLLLALSDGMGGHEAGEVASRLSLETLLSALQGAPESVAVEESLSAAVAAANAEVRLHASGSGARGMGATLTVVLLRGEEAVIAEVGDSRAYLYRGGRLEQVTHDQSLVQYLVDKGALSPEEARASSRKNILLQAVGRADEIQVAVGRLQLRKGDRFLLCCDGLTNAVTDEELQGLVAGDDLAASCGRMIDLANERGGTDNITVVVAEATAESLPAPSPNETAAETLESLRRFSGPA